MLSQPKQILCKLRYRINTELATEQLLINDVWTMWSSVDMKSALNHSIMFILHIIMTHAKHSVILLKLFSNVQSRHPGHNSKIPMKNHGCAHIKNSLYINATYKSVSVLKKKSY